MTALASENPAPFDPTVGRAHFLLSLTLAWVLFFAVVSVSFHHHGDLADHPDCAICAVAQHTGVEPFSPIPAVVGPAVPPSLFTLLVLSVPEFRPVSLRRSRAPPQ